jgi:uncharacterized membrane protein (DUF373 family)
MASSRLRWAGIDARFKKSPRMAEHPRLQKAPFKRAIAALEWVERSVFVLIGVMLFGAALVLLARSGVYLFVMATETASGMTGATAFLDLVLLVLMIVELAYTVVLSLRGNVLQAEPFLIVGLIAVIRRILVITVNEAQHSAAAASSAAVLQELEVLTAVTAVLVVSIAVLRIRPLRHAD